MLASELRVAVLEPALKERTSGRLRHVPGVTALSARYLGSFPSLHMNSQIRNLARPKAKQIKS